MKLSNARGTNAGVNNDTAGELRFLANDDANNLQSFGNIKVTATDVTDESETGKMTLGVSSSDTGAIDDIIQIQGGSSAVTSQTDIAGVATVGSTLTVDGATAIKSTLSVTGATNITSTLDVTGHVHADRFGANTVVTEPGKVVGGAGWYYPILLLEDGTAWMGSDITIDSESSWPFSFTELQSKLSTFTNHYNIYSDVEAVAGNYYHNAVILKSGKIITWGRAYHGDGAGLGHDQTYAYNEIVNTPREVQNITNAKSVVWGNYNANAGTAAAVLKDGRVMRWGRFLGSVPVPVSWQDWPNEKAVQVQMTGNGSDNLFILLDTGRIKVSAANHHWVNGGADSSTNYLIPNLTNIIQIENGTHSMYALASDGAVYSWGYISTSTEHLGRAGLQVNTHHPVGQVDGSGLVGYKNCYRYQ